MVTRKQGTRTKSRHVSEWQPWQTLEGGMRVIPQDELLFSMHAFNKDQTPRLFQATDTRE
jgi:hypothetical protein